MKKKYLLFSGLIFTAFVLFIALSFNEEYSAKLMQFINSYDFTGMLISIGILLICLLVELFFLPLKDSSIYKILHPNKSVITDIVIGLSYSLAVFFFIKTLLMIGLDYHFNGLFKIKSSSSNIVYSFYYVLNLLLFIVVADFFNYIYHWLCHELDFIWQIHKYHHASTDFVILSGNRLHPIEHIGKKFFIVLPLVLLGIRVESYLIVSFLILFIEKFQHSIVDWDYGWVGKYIIYSPIGHRIHHSKEEEHWDKNFGDLFVFWDRIFGTYYDGDKINTEVGVSDNWMNKNGIIYDLWHSTYLSYRSFINGIKKGHWRPEHKRKK